MGKGKRRGREELTFGRLAHVVSWCLTVTGFIIPVAMHPDVHVNTRGLFKR